MARVTIEDCVDKVESRFELVCIASILARKINSGAAITVDRKNDKDAVMALREIASGSINIETLKDQMILAMRMRKPVEALNDDLHIDLTEGDIPEMHEEISYDSEDLDFSDDIIEEEDF